MHFCYKLLTYFFYPLAHFYLFIRKLKKKEHSKRYREKLSSTKISRPQGFLLWFHVASVGEAMSILPLIENFEKEENIKTILITTITLSSAQILEKRFINNSKVIHQFLPLDIPKFVNKFLNHWSPNLAIFIDSEIWPNLIFNIKKKNIPLLLVNARITKKTFLRWKILKNFSKKIFEKFDLCLAANNETENYLNILGAKKVKNLGNLKFAKTKSKLEQKLNNTFLEKVKNKKIWCAASTHPSEELFCGKTHLILKKIYYNTLTIIAPRHINRVNEIKKDLDKLNLRTCLYSAFDKIDDRTDILLIDSYGELTKLYNITNNVFLGKSLISSMKNDSGQNPIEAARLGCKIFHGANVSNFSDIYKYLNSLGVTKKIASCEELSQSLVEEFKNKTKNKVEIPEKIEIYGQNILNSVLNEIKIYINS